MANDIARFVQQIVERGESDYVPGLQVEQVVELLRERSITVSNIEGYVIAAGRDVQQEHLFRYDKRLHRECQPDRDLPSAAAEAALRFLNLNYPSRRDLHFKIFA